MKTVSSSISRGLILFAGTFLAGLLATEASAAELPEWTGSLKSLDVYGAAAPADLFPDYRFSSNRLRLDLGWQQSRQVRLESSLDYQLLWTEPDGILPLTSNGINRTLDLDRTWQLDHAWDSRLQIDQLNLRYNSSDMNLVIGRQAIGFGRIVIFSPLDIIAPFPPDALDTDVRPGIDALRATTYYGQNGQLGGVFVWGDQPRHNSWMAIWSDNRHGLDLLAIGGSLRQRAMAGVGLAGSLGTLGLKAEVAVYDGQRTGQPQEDLYPTFAIAAMEAWYRFDNGLTLIGQYLYNSPGSDDPGEYPQVAASAPLREGLTALLGRNYLLAAPSYELHPLATLQGLMIWNLDDDSLLFRPTLVFEAGDNLTMELFCTTHTGEKPVAGNSLLPPVPRSEFGLRGNSGGVFLKYFF